jgi:hypothetical protein
MPYTEVLENERWKWPPPWIGLLSSLPKIISFPEWVLKIPAAIFSPQIGGY